MTNLTAVHDGLLDALSALAEALAGDAPDRAAVASARWKLSRASGLRRKMLTETIYPSIERAGHAEKIAVLQREDKAMTVTSAKHIARWTPEAIAADWAGYRAASATMRAAMQRRIEAERAILYPLLAALDRPS